MNISSGDSLALLIRYSTRRLNLCAMHGVYGLSGALLLLKAVNPAFLLCLNASHLSWALSLPCTKLPYTFTADRRSCEHLLQYRYICIYTTEFHGDNPLFHVSYTAEQGIFHDHPNRVMFSVSMRVSIYASSHAYQFTNTTLLRTHTDTQTHTDTHKHTHTHTHTHTSQCQCII